MIYVFEPFVSLKIVKRSFDNSSLVIILIFSCILQLKARCCMAHTKEFRFYILNFKKKITIS